MSNLIAVCNVSEGTFEQREMTAEELAADELVQAQSAQLAAETAAKEAARLALLDKLGITADEAKLLLG